jgi:LMBR1 domain-containing protein 1
MTILLIPIDVANNEGSVSCDGTNNSVLLCGGLDMRSFWETLFCIITLTLVLLVPMTTFYYEADDGSLLNDGVATNWRICTALKYEVGLLIVAALAIVPCYLTVADVNLPLEQYSVSLDDLPTYILDGPTEDVSILSLIDMNITAEDTSREVGRSRDYNIFTSDFIVYMAGIASWVGWWLFSTMTGVGLVALPMGLFHDFQDRPRVLPLDKMAAIELELQRRTTELVNESTEMRRERAEFRMSGASSSEKRKQWAADRLRLNKLQQQYFFLQKDLELFEGCKKIKQGYNPLIPYFKLLAGFFTFAISVLWVAHLCAYVLEQPPRTMLLNRMFEWFDIWFPMFGALCYALFCLYLIFCSIKGLFLMGMKMFCIKIHPMKLGNTPVNSFLFNISIMLLCSLPLVHVCTVAFADYARNTEILYIFTVHIQHLTFFNIFFMHDVFVYIICVVAGLTLLLSLCSKRPKAVTDFDRMQQITSATVLESVLGKQQEKAKKPSKRSARRQRMAKEAEMSAQNRAAEASPQSQV